MLAFDARQRITIDEALQHPYVNLWYDLSEVRLVSHKQLFDLSLQARTQPSPIGADGTDDGLAHEVDEWRGAFSRDFA